MTLLDGLRSIGGSRRFTAGLALAFSAVANADVIQFADNFRAPALNANQSIAGFNLMVNISSSAVAKASPAAPTLGMKSIKNPFGPGTEMVPIVTNGVDPKTGDTTMAQFVYDSFSVAAGKDMFIANVPLIPAGATTRTDTVTVTWDSIAGGPTFPASNMLRFGVGIDRARALNAGGKVAFGDKVTLVSGKYTLNDNTSADVSQSVLNTIEMGQDATDPDTGILTPGLAFAYTNNAANPVDLSGLTFLTSLNAIDIDSVNISGNSLPTPQVFLNGIMLGPQSSYDVPSNATIQFIFPDTTDPIFIAQGDVYVNGVDQLGFTYEDQLTTPEPATGMLLGSAVLLLLGMRAGLRRLKLDNSGPY
jgi:hypothetical protein